MNSVKGELVWTTTGDRTRLNGFFVEAATPKAIGIDAAVILHGLAGNFYSSSLLTFVARQLTTLGVNVVLANTRGHDFLNHSTQSGRSVLAGAAVENVDDCRFDVTGWVKYLAAAGHQRVLLAGHSLGAIKSLYSQAHARHENVAGILGLSSTRLNYHQFATCSAREKFLSSFALAEEMIRANRSDELFRFEFPFPTWMGARSFVDKYGMENRFDWTNFIDMIPEPILLTFGQRELEEHPAFEGVEDVAAEIAERQPNVSVKKVVNADHFYVACFDQLWSDVEPWLRHSFRV
jgi:pimeloyl-ACP methyl ester carboxylesterase